MYCISAFKNSSFNEYSLGHTLSASSKMLQNVDRICVQQLSKIAQSMIPEKTLILNANNLPGRALDFEAANLDKLQSSHI